MSEMRDGSVKRSGRKMKKIVLAITASLAGATVAGVAATVCAYDAFFERYERPDYSVYPGLYDYEKLREVLPRETFTFMSDGVRLAGYFYPSADAKGLVVVAHGFHAGADDYLPLIEAIVNGGYSVIAYDIAGTYDSEGDSNVGMCQTLKDLDAALNYVKEDNLLSKMPLFLLGHSWGGYAVSSVLELHPEVRACVCIAPMYSGASIMVEKAEQYAGKIAYASKPIFDIYQKILFGDYVNYNAVRGINSTDIPVLIAQGVDDKVITAKEQSITAHRAEITNPNVEYYWGLGSQGDHLGIWHSDASCEYQRDVESRLKLLELEAGRELTGEERAEFYKGIDHRLYSEVDPVLLSKIFETFEKGV